MQDRMLFKWSGVFFHKSGDGVRWGKIEKLSVFWKNSWKRGTMLCGRGAAHFKTISTGKQGKVAPGFLGGRVDHNEGIGRIGVILRKRHHAAGGIRAVSLSCIHASLPHRAHLFVIIVAVSNGEGTILIHLNGIPGVGVAAYPFAGPLDSRPGDDGIVFCAVDIFIQLIYEFRVHSAPAGGGDPAVEIGPPFPDTICAGAPVVSVAGLRMRPPLKPWEVMRPMALRDSGRLAISFA